MVTKATAVDLGMVLQLRERRGTGATTSGTLATVRRGRCGRGRLRTARAAAPFREPASPAPPPIIAIDPIRMRRELAMKVGATHALDPNPEGDGIIERVRSLTERTDEPCVERRPRLGRAAERSRRGSRRRGGRCGIRETQARNEPGPDRHPPDAAGISDVQRGRHVITTGLVRGTIALPAFLFAIGGITHSGGQAGGANPMSDIPRFVAMLDSGRYDAKALVTRVVAAQGHAGAYEEVAYRTTVTAIMTA